MSTESVNKTEITSSGIPERTRRLAWLGPPPLFEGEDTVAYDELLARISGAMKPADIFEEVWVRDIVDLSWEVLRLRRLKASLMTATAYEGLHKILEPFLELYDERDQLVRGWAARHKTAIKQVDRLLASAGLTMDAVMAQTLLTNLDHIERMERLIATAEARRDAILCEVERHRATWGQELRRAVQQAEDAEIKVIEDGKTRNAA